MIDPRSVDPRIVAHRGWTRSHLENTREALAAAVAGGCAAVEFDVRRTRDGYWVVSHDASLERLHGVTLSIADASLAEIHEHAPLPLLAEALEILAGCALPMVEVKETESPGIDQLCAVLARWPHPVVAVARSEAVVAALHEHAPGVDIYLYQRDWKAAAAAPAQHLAGYDLWAMGATPATGRELLPTLGRAGRKVAVWTVNEPDAARAWLAAGAHWVISDRPWEMTTKALAAAPE